MYYLVLLKVMSYKLLLSLGIRINLFDSCNIYVFRNKDGGYRAEYGSCYTYLHSNSVPCLPRFECTSSSDPRKAAGFVSFFGISI